jgi:opacity protein-like surface antigen
VDALYKRVGFEGATTGAIAATTRTTANSWEFPIYGKFEIVPGPVRPFLDAGVSVRHLSGISQVRSVLSGVTLNTVNIDNPPEFNKDTDVGFVFGGGIAFKISRVRVSPELRYTHWGGENLRDPINSLLRTNRNQGEFLLGLTF